MKIDFLILGLTLSFLTSLALAEIPANSYSIRYASSSPLKTVPLENATLKISVFYYAIPKGYSTVTTNVNKTFTFNYGDEGSQVTLSVISIAGEEKYSALCHGSPLPDDLHQIAITCENSNSSSPSG